MTLRLLLPAVGRRLRAPSRRPSTAATALVVLAALAVGCGAPDGSGTAPAPADGGAVADAPTAGGVVIGPEASVPPRSADLVEVGGLRLELGAYPVDEALAAEGGAAVADMLERLDVSPAEVELSLGVAEAGDPTLSDWHLPRGSASDILEAWGASAPGSWRPDDLGDVPALSGTGLDGAMAWALAVDGRFVYVRTASRETADAVARLIGR